MRGGGLGGGTDAAMGATAAEGAAADGPAANYFSGRKRQKGDAAGQQGLGLLLDRGRGAGDGRSTDDTMEFMEVREACERGVWGNGCRFCCCLFSFVIRWLCKD